MRCIAVDVLLCRNRTAADFSIKLKLRLFVFR